MSDNLPADKNAIIAEYVNIRAEILQLNGQGFTILTVSLGLNMSVIGWMFSKTDPSQYIYLLTIGVIIGFVGCLLLLNKNRLAHRLAYFQEFFIESRIPDICWARVGFMYRDKYKEISQKRFSSWSERIAESGVYTITVAQIVNIIIFLFYAVLPWFKSDSTIIDWFKVVNGIIILIILWIQYYAMKNMVGYKTIKKAMNEVYKETSLN